MNPGSEELPGYFSVEMAEICGFSSFLESEGKTGGEEGDFRIS